jgi:hypothetical protein
MKPAPGDSMRSVGARTKSPMRSWKPKAMSMPTPMAMHE